MDGRTYRQTDHYLFFRVKRFTCIQVNSLQLRASEMEGREEMANKARRPKPMIPRET